MAGKGRWRPHDDDEGGVTSAAIRGFILVAAVVVGAVVIANAFPGTSGPAPEPSLTVTPTHDGSTPSPSKTKPAIQCPSPQGIRAAVENATGTAGLAAATVTRLKPAGYVINVSTDVGNASTDSATTTVYFRTADDKTAAICMKKKFFKIATVKKLTADITAEPSIDPAVRIAVFLGEDYATAHPVS